MAWIKVIFPDEAEGELKEVYERIGRQRVDEGGVPAELVPAIREMRSTYTTRGTDMDPRLLHRLGLFDYLRCRLAVAGTPEDCIAQVRAARAAGARNLMFTVSLAADPVRTVELFGKEVLPVVSRD